MARVAMILKSSPYGDVAAAEAVRHALGAVSQTLTVDLILMGGGVNLARKGQDDAQTGYMNLESSLKDCIEMGVMVHAEESALASHGVGGPNLLEGVSPLGAAGIGRLVKEARWTMIF